MSSYPPRYPADLFPNNNLPEMVTRTANLMVRCRYAEAGVYGAALLLRADEGVKGCRVVVEPLDRIDDWINQFTEHARTNGLGEFFASSLTLNDVMDMHRQAIDELDGMLESLRPKAGEA